MVNTYRHNPTQERSRSRVAAILRSSEVIFARVGYEAATTNAIAEHAKIPIGSLYQYFKNKQGILRALADRYVAEYKELFVRSIEEKGSSDDSIAITDYMTDVTIRYYQQHPAFMVVFYGTCCGNDFSEISEAFLQELIQLAVAYLHSRYPRFSEHDLEVMMTVLIKSARSIYPMAVRPDGSVDERYRRELKRLAKAYLRDALDGN